MLNGLAQYSTLSVSTTASIKILTPASIKITPVDRSTYEFSGGFTFAPGTSGDVHALMGPCQGRCTIFLPSLFCTEAGYTIFKIHRELHCESWCVQKTLTKLQPVTYVSRCQCVRIEDRHHFYWLFGLQRLQPLSDGCYRAEGRRYCLAFVAMVMFCYVWESAKMCSRPKVAVTTLTSGLIHSK